MSSSDFIAFCACGCGNLLKTKGSTWCRGHSPNCRKVEKTGDALIKRFMSFVFKHDSGCWEWQGSRHGKGYGHFKFKGLTEKAHRASYVIFRGDIPYDLCVCHSCDNPWCVNPEHLWLGTKTENNIDRQQKGRWRDWWAMKRSGEVSRYSISMEE